MRPSLAATIAVNVNAVNAVNATIPRCDHCCGPHLCAQNVKFVKRLIQEYIKVKEKETLSGQVYLKPEQFDAYLIDGERPVM